MSCKACKAWGNPSNVIYDNHVLYFNVNTNEKNGPYMKISLLTGGAKPPRIICESASENLVNRGAIDINFCPMCGRKLGE